MLGAWRRLTAAAMAGLIGCALFPAPAAAGDGTGGVQCTGGNTPACDISAGTPGGAGGGQSGGGTGAEGTGGNDRCSYRRASPSPATIEALGGQPSGDGGWYFKTCVEPDGTVVAYRGPTWMAGGPPVVTPEELAYQARARLHLPDVVIRMNPPGDQLVNLPVWLTLDPASWRTQSATASVPGVSVTATARPVKASWWVGDGMTVTCGGPGTAWTSGTDPAKASPDCGHVYRRSSANVPGGAYVVAVTVTWEVTWAGAGQSGTVPGLTTTGQVQTRVQESQALVS